MAENENRTRVVILAGPYRIKGEIALVAGARLTDYMVESKGFIAVTQAEVWDLEGRRILVADFLDLSREHIVVVAPE
jgi:hypothetical protein